MKTTVHTQFNVSPKNGKLIRDCLAEFMVAQDKLDDIRATVVPLSNIHKFALDGQEPVIELWLLVLTGDAKQVDSIVSSLLVLGARNVRSQMEEAGS